MCLHPWTHQYTPRTAQECRVLPKEYRLCRTVVPFGWCPCALFIELSSTSPEAYHRHGDPPYSRVTYITYIYLRTSIFTIQYSATTIFNIWHYLIQHFSYFISLWCQLSYIYLNPFTISPNCAIILFGMETCSVQDHFFCII